MVFHGSSFIQFIHELFLGLEDLLEINQILFVLVPKGFVARRMCYYVTLGSSIYAHFGDGNESCSERYFKTDGSGEEETVLQLLRDCNGTSSIWNCAVPQS
ncbi:hypothetical protein Ancab_035688 [Ancistrocladus abbreviatus]